MKNLLFKTIFIGLILCAIPAQKSFAAPDGLGMLTLTAAGYAAGWAYDIGKDKDRLSQLAAANAHHPYNTQRDNRPAYWTGRHIALTSLGLFCFLLNNKNIIDPAITIGLTSAITATLEAAEDKKRLDNAANRAQPQPQEEQREGFRLGDRVNIAGREEISEYNLHPDSRPGMLAAIGGLIGFVLGFISDHYNTKP